MTHFSLYLSPKSNLTGALLLVLTWEVSEVSSTLLGSL